MSYVFEPNVEIGDIPAGGRFPFRTVMQFDYGFLRGDDWSLQQQFDDLKVKCHLDREEYLCDKWGKVYRSFKSPRDNADYKAHLIYLLCARDTGHGIPH